MGLEILSGAGRWVRQRRPGKVTAHDRMDLILQSRPAGDEPGENWMPTVKGNGFAAQSGNKPSRGFNESDTRGDIPLALRRKSPGGVGQAGRYQRQLVRHGALGADVERPGFESVPVATLVLAPACQYQRVRQAGTFAGPDGFPL